MISTECPCVNIFLTYDFVGHCEEVASDCAMQHEGVSVHASAGALAVQVDMWWLFR